MIETTITELDGLYREAVATGDWSAADHYDRQISLKMAEMYKSGEPSFAVERIQSLGRHSKELFEGTTEELANLTAMV